MLPQGPHRPPKQRLITRKAAWRRRRRGKREKREERKDIESERMRSRDKV